MPLNEADTCRVYVTPKLREAGWERNLHSLTEQKTFTDGRVELRGNAVKRGEQKRAGYLQRYTLDFPIAVVEAKPESDPAGKGMQQAKEYAEILDLKFAYSTNGHQIVEFDYLTGQEAEVPAFPSPIEIFERLKAREGMVDEVADRLLTPSHHLPGHTPRYHQEIAINRVVQAIAKDTRRPGLYREYPRDFFDLIIVDECHRSSARDDSNWQEILEYFEPAFQLGMTATPLREDKRDTYEYFGNPLYVLHLAGEGI